MALGPGPGSLIRRLIVSLVVANMVMLVATAGLYLWRGYSANASEVPDHLDHHAHDLAIAALRGPDGIPVLPEEAGAIALFDAASGKAAPGSDRELVDRLPRLIARGLVNGLITFEQEDGELLTIAAATAERPGGEVIAAVLHRGPLTENLWSWLSHEIASDVVPVFLPPFLLTLLVSVAAVRRGMAPVRDLSRQVRDIAPDRLDVRLSTARVPAEMLPLVAAINGSLDRVAAGFESQRRFTADAAHELRTPLAVLRARCSGVESGELRKALFADVDRMARVIEQLLAVARLEARGLDFEGPIDLAEVAEQVVVALFPLARQVGRGLGLTTHARPVLANGNAQALHDALRNLVENALRVTPDGGEVDLEVGPDATIRVLDRGPGVPDVDKASIFRPFHRGTGSHGGCAGLGLCIAGNVVALHGGRLAVEDRTGGGAVFIMIF